MGSLIDIIFKKYLGSRLACTRPALNFWKAVHKYAVKAHGVDNYDAGGFLTGENYMISFINKKFQPKILVDVGANTGGYTHAFKQVNPHIKVIGFEPHPDNYEKLQRRFTQDKDCTFYKYGVGNPAGSGIEVLTLYDYASGNGSEHASFHPDTFFTIYRQSIFDLKGIEVPVISLDDFLYDKLNYIDFLKIDTEGFELEVLKGADKFIQNKKVGFIQFEFNYTHLERTYFVAFWRLLNTNYKIYRLLPKGFLPITSYDITNEIFKYQNYLAVNKDIQLL